MQKEWTINPLSVPNLLNYPDYILAYFKNQGGHSFFLFHHQLFFFIHVLIFFPIFVIIYI